MIDKTLELIFTARLDKSYEEKLRQAAEKLRQDIGRPIDIKINADEEAKIYQLVLKTTNALGQQATSTYQIDVATDGNYTHNSRFRRNKIFTEKQKIQRESLLIIR